MDEPIDVSATLQDAIEAVIGEYVPVPQFEEYVAVDGTVSIVTRYTPDWLWFGSLVILLCAMFCFFRAVGGVLKCKI